MRPLLLQAGLSFDEQYGTLVDMVAANLSAGPDVTEDDINWFNQVALIWSLQVGLSATLNTYTVCCLSLASSIDRRLTTYTDFYRE